MIPHLVRVTQEACPAKLLPDDPTWADGNAIPSLPCFIESVVRESSVDVSTLAVTVIYLRRLQSHLFSKPSKDYPSTAHRIFLAAVMMAFKYLDGNAPKSRKWAHCIFVPEYDEFWFPISQINVMEMELLHCLDWKLNVTLEEFKASGKNKSHLPKASCSLLRGFLDAKGQRSR